jgi:hypothetical protein
VIDGYAETWKNNLSANKHTSSQFKMELDDFSALVVIKVIPFSHERATDKRAIALNQFFVLGQGSTNG